ncbi:MAG: response regulator [Chloroflexi bacterium]|nr:response regulator [Chloroflexota bacterium]
MPLKILVVEDNPITLKLIRITLQSDGYEVLDSRDGPTAIEIMVQRQPDLILLDLVLPDLDGLDLGQRLRTLARSAHLPIIGYSGLSEKLDQARALEGVFTHFIKKPFEPSRLMQILRDALTPEDEARPRLTLWRSRASARVLIVDDEPLQRKLMTIHFTRLGFQVSTAEDGPTALEQARSSPPDVIVSDVLMPVLDGFELCIAARQMPELARVPIVLISSVYVEEEDRRLAMRVGANAFVARTPDYAELLQTVMVVVDETIEGPPQNPSAHSLRLEHTIRVAWQLDRQASLNARLSQRLAWLEAKLAMLGGIADTILRASATEPLLDEIFYRALEASGASRGAIYFPEPGSEIPGRFLVRMTLGFDDTPLTEQATLCGENGLLQRAMDSREAIQIPSVAVSGEAASNLLECMEAKSMLITPMVSNEGCFAIMMTAWAEQDIEADVQFLTTTISSQASQAVTLVNALAQLQQQRQQLESALQWRNEITANLSHDLKNPLTSIKGYAQMLRSRAKRLAAPDAEWVENVTTTIDEMATRMSGEIDSLLDLADMQVGQSLHLNVRETNLVALARQACENALAAARGHKIAIDAPQPELVGTWDPIRIERVLANLVSNAIKYSPDGSEVSVRISAENTTEGRWAVIEIRDRGIGIPSADLPHLFERFYRASNVTGHVAGSGLGLVSARQIVEQHGGTITAASQEGIGSTFAVRLPLPPQPPMDHRPICRDGVAK